jgi:hypothetical protein
MHAAYVYELCYYSILDCPHKNSFTFASMFNKNFHIYLLHSLKKHRKLIMNYVILSYAYYCTFIYIYFSH